MDTEIRVSTESRPWRKKFSRRSSRDSNPRPFNHESGALTTELSPPPGQPNLCLMFIHGFLFYVCKVIGLLDWLDKAYIYLKKGFQFVFYPLLTTVLKNLNTLKFLTWTHFNRYCVSTKCVTPWDNRNGWLGVKHQNTYLLCSLYWLPVHLRMNTRLRVCATTFYWLFFLLLLLLTVYTRSTQLRSSSHRPAFRIPLMKTKSFGQRSLSSTGPVQWNYIIYYIIKYNQWNCINDLIN